MRQVIQARAQIHPGITIATTPGPAEREEGASGLRRVGAFFRGLDLVNRTRPLGLLMMALCRFGKIHGRAPAQADSGM
ncbi:hypothetical protein [Bradyrhizobium sp. CCBAU 53415]|uniref:hypothetical protein n=1 Tax=Bradyrhizobium sp. CCBAU 53415 TaxID=1325119 RepID=UPI002306D40E|nr:hypothetical protein [Bradyrhizobium sp. CCBAU 53415]MDA9469840.1 hypothetical protein [Bradyrhizobium sp. CCBAU 53415]